MPGLRRPKPDAAEALVAVAPLVTRWIERLLATHDPPLTVPQYLALRAIARERLIGTELARRAGISGPAVSQLVTALADAGLLTRLPVHGDRRRQELELTPNGLRALESANTLLRVSLAAVLEALPRSDADALGRLLPRVEGLLSGAPPPRRPHPAHPPRRPRPHQR